MSNQPCFCGFLSLEDALQHRATSGGWVFEGEAGQVIWFDHTFRPTSIFTHYALTGMSGRLV